MKKKIISLLCGAMLGLPLCAQTNYAVHLDGKDNNLRIGMDSICRHWTLEAWIKPDSDAWKKQEVIIGGGEYSELNSLDYLPLVIRNGCLYNAGADLTGGKIPVGQWSHVAATCDGTSVKLYLNGNEVARRDTATVILPGAIGINETAESIFGGLMDEVRIWTTGLSRKVLKEWMCRPLTARHPEFGHLKGYYDFDDFSEDMSVNRAARGRLSFHLRNGRLKQYGEAPLAYKVKNDNLLFKSGKADKEQELFKVVALPAEWDADQETEDFQLLKLRVETDGSRKSLQVKQLEIDLSGCTSLEDLERIHLYYTGSKPRSSVREELVEGGIAPEKKLRITLPEKLRPALRHGTNYLLITADIAPDAVARHQLAISVSSVKIGKKALVPERQDDCLPVQITLNSRNNPKILKVMQWNVWHGGKHLGKDGRERIIDLIRQSHADLVTMQEGYGSQEMIAEALGFRLQTPSAGDNLALFSRYPLQKIKTAKTFNSNPAIVSLPGGQKVYINDCWLRYAYRPEYTSYNANSGMDPDGWAREDSILGLQDIRYILEKDLYPHISEDMPAIIGGDFNAASHLDMTARAAHLHFGYTAEKLPISRFLTGEGFKDSFREMHPDEVERGEGSYAVILGQSQHMRIDFLYYKGRKIKAVSSKIVRTMPEIDDVWPGDHAAVLTVFELE